MSRFAPTPDDVKVLSTGQSKRYLVQAPEIEDLDATVDLLKPLIAKHQARLLDYDGEKLVLFVEVDDDRAKALFGSFPKGVTTKPAKKQKSGPPSTP